MNRLLGCVLSCSKISSGVNNACTNKVVTVETRPLLVNRHRRRRAEWKPTWTAIAEDYAETEVEKEGNVKRNGGDVGRLSGSARNIATLTGYANNYRPSRHTSMSASFSATPFMI